MSNYLNSEIYRVLHSKKTYFLIAGFAATALLMEGLMLFMATKILTTKDIFYSLFECSKLLGFLCVIIASAVFAEESKIHTLKNTVAYGISRGEIFFGRLMTELLVAFMCFFAALAAYIAGAYLLFADGSVIYLTQFIIGMLGMIPMLVLCMVFTHSLYYIIDNETVLLIIMIIVIGVLPKILSFLGSQIELAGAIADCMPWYILSDITVNNKTGDYILGWITNEGMMRCLLVGILGSVVCYIIGLVVFKKKEIK